MITVWKYTLPVGDDESKKAVPYVIQMPMGGEVLRVGPQYDANGKEVIIAHVWVDSSKPLVNHAFVIMGTGHEMPPSNPMPNYVGTVSMEGSKKMWHVFHHRMGR